MSPFHFSSPWRLYTTMLEATWQLTSSPGLGVGGGMCVRVCGTCWASWESPMMGAPGSLGFR